ncbi:chromosomal replication initiator DnaA [Litorisediminicola beolgyonensis]|uniref:Chromosomal replication initiator DnaA n=1 Tax=Litorisediminicola beolgyonensis TaxID=1173614 RepID=A0ABW3ZDY3_9RHOB
MSSQRQAPLPLDLPSRAALGRGDFFVAEANAMAVAQVDGWRSWPGGKLVLAGPRGSGKTHLAHVWSAESGALIVSAGDLAGSDIPRLTRRALCVENVDRIAGDPEAEEALFHVHNLALAERQPLLMTAASPPSNWGITLPDLASRMMGTQVARLSKPDDQLLTAVLAKLFADRQIVPALDVIPYLVRHMRRSFDMAGQIVSALDQAALGTPKGVTRSLARRVLVEIDPPDAP